MGTSRSRTPANLQYEPRVDILQHDYAVCAANFGKLARVVPSEVTFSTQNLDPRRSRNMVECAVLFSQYCTFLVPLLLLAGVLEASTATVCMMAMAILGVLVATR